MWAGADLGENGQDGRSIAGYHYDLNFMVSCRSRRLIRNDLNNCAYFCPAYRYDPRK